MNELCQEYLVRAEKQEAMFQELRELRNRLEYSNPTLITKPLNDYPKEYQEKYWETISYVKETFALEDKLKESIPNKTYVTLPDKKILVRDGNALNTYGPMV